jgi:hypothetical protein
MFFKSFYELVSKSPIGHELLEFGPATPELGVELEYLQQLLFFPAAKQKSHNNLLL